MTPATLPILLAFLGNIGPWQIALVAVIGLIIFGKRLPEVGKSLGKGIVEFKKGLQGLNDEIESAGKDTKKLEDPVSRSSETTTSESAEKTQA